MGCKARRIAAMGLAWGCALLLGASLTSCAAPKYTYISDSKANTYFKVPYGWHQVSQDKLCTELKSAPVFGSCTGTWVAAYEAGQKASAPDLVAVNNTEPFVYVAILPVPATLSGQLTPTTLRDLILPVSSTGIATLQSNGFPLSKFTQIRDSTVTLPKGVQGVRETFIYTYLGGIAETFDKIVLTNADQSVLYLVLLHCTAACYSQDTHAIDDVMSSFTVRSQ